MFTDVRICQFLTRKLSKWRGPGHVTTFRTTTSNSLASRRRYTTTSQLIANPTSSEAKLGDLSDNERPSIYINPVCMQLDQLLHNCDNYDSLLGVLVTHRGVMYLHNLVTVMTLLRDFAEKDKGEFQPDADDLFAGYSEMHSKQKTAHTTSIDESRLTKTQKAILAKAKSEILVHLEDPKNEHYMKASQHSRKLSDAIIRDERLLHVSSLNLYRYDLLLQDLYVNRNKLDIASACHVIISLDSLGHKYFRLYNGILKHLLRMPMPFSDEDPQTVNDIGNLLIKTCHCYVKAGFYDIPLYNRVCKGLFTSVSSGMSESEGFHRLLMNVVRLYGSVKSYDCHVFERIAELVQDKRLSAQDVSLLALAFSAHQNYTRLHDRVMYKVANEIETRPLEFGTRDLYNCISSFSNMSLYFERCWRIFSERLIEGIMYSINTADKLEFSVPELSSIVEKVCRIDNTSPFVNKLVEYTLIYLEDHINDITEDSAINLASSISLTNNHGKHDFLKPLYCRDEHIHATVHLEKSW
ncbi:hypothetical protein BEWA_004730 [Theileria equi strain WA]|uniref:Uncharacterized protein n=1 Tax=Theileria equi strain WA TaxID=1537102 RepID=L0AZS0_THEEQ|nr:hypothetical protein BEWA_004730 [Theileria equi strain WA]AFZ81065.1 hypothetical protein BEWA_004730 [Theileria equi strain WA]|eukprot:XP_004830731.1 hypothetical protein BEWA_004730 [Theileria equi strain WA]